MKNKLSKLDIANIVVWSLVVISMIASFISAQFFVSEIGGFVI